MKNTSVRLLKTSISFLFLFLLFNSELSFAKRKNKKRKEKKTKIFVDSSWSNLSHISNYLKYKHLKYVDQSFFDSVWQSGFKVNRKEYDSLYQIFEKPSHNIGSNNPGVPIIDSIIVSIESEKLLIEHYLYRKYNTKYNKIQIDSVYNSGYKVNRTELQQLEKKYREENKR